MFDNEKSMYTGVNPKQPKLFSSIQRLEMAL